VFQIEKLIKIVLQPLHISVSAKPKVNLRAINQRHLFLSILKSALRISQPLPYLAATILQFNLQLLSNQFLYWENEFYSLPMLISLWLLLVSKKEKRANSFPSIPGGHDCQDKMRNGMNLHNMARNVRKQKLLVWFGAFKDYGQMRDV
jgi:hypothetical protein